MHAVIGYKVFLPNMLSLVSFTPEDLVKVAERYFSAAVSITSESGVGSSTAMKGLIRKMNGFTRAVSGGGLMRMRAENLGISIEDLAAEAAAGNYCHDQWLDAQLALFGVQNHTLMESRLAHLWMPMAFRVKLVCPIDVRAERRASQLSRSVHLVKQEIIQRDVHDNTRYASLYPGCLWGDDSFDVVVNTAERNELEVVNDIINAHKSWCDVKASRGLICSDVFIPA